MSITTNARSIAFEVRQQVAKYTRNEKQLHVRSPPRGPLCWRKRTAGQHSGNPSDPSVGTGASENEDAQTEEHQSVIDEKGSLPSNSRLPAPDLSLAKSKPGFGGSLKSLLRAARSDPFGVLPTPYGFLEHVLLDHCTFIEPPLHASAFLTSSIH